jgi:hypothetical protein
MPLAKGAAETRSGKQPDNIVAMPRTAKKPEMSAAMRLAPPFLDQTIRSRPRALRCSSTTLSGGDALTIRAR